MIRSIIFGASLASLVPVLGNALASRHWLAAVPLAALLIAGIVKLAPDAVASPDPASAATDALAIGGER